MQNITYHRATPNDIQTLVDYRTLFAIEMAGEQTPQAIAELKQHFKTYFQKAISNNSCIGYIAKQGNQVAGIGALIVREQPGNFKNPSGKVGYYMNMYTVPSFRRKGVCSGILKALEKAAAETGITAFELHATKDGEFVYHQHGFKLHNEPTYRKYL